MYLVNGKPRKSILVLGSERPTPEMLAYTSRLIKVVWWHKLNLIIGDGYGVEAQAAATAQQYGMPYRCYGINRKPRNGARYYDRVTGSYITRDLHLVKLADVAVIIGNDDVYYYTQVAFPEKDVRLKLFRTV